VIDPRQDTGLLEFTRRLIALRKAHPVFGLGTYEPMLITKKPSDYLREIHMDTVCYHPPALACAYAWTSQISPDGELVGQMTEGFDSSTLDPWKRIEATATHHDAEAALAEIDCVTGRLARILIDAGLNRHGHAERCQVCDQCRDIPLVFDGVDSRQLALQRAQALGIDTRLVHETVVEVGNPACV
jgi:hypothetical protein